MGNEEKKAGDGTPVKKGAGCLEDRGNRATPEGRGCSKWKGGKKNKVQRGLLKKSWRKAYWQLKRKVKKGKNRKEGVSS